MLIWDVYMLDMYTNSMMTESHSLSDRTTARFVDSFTGGPT